MMLKRDLSQMFSINHKAVWVVLISTISAIVLSLAAQPVAASPTTPDWIGADPVVVSHEVVSEADQYAESSLSSCHIQTVSYVANVNMQVPEQKRMCVVEGDGFRVAMSGNPYQIESLAVSFGFSHKFYRLTYPGQSSGFKMVFLPGSQKYLWVTSSWRGSHLSLYDNFLKSIRRNSSGWYEVDMSLSELIWQKENAVRGWGVSDNGRYVVYGVSPSFSSYSYPYVIVLEDIVTGEISRIGTNHYIFEAYPMGHPQLKVSNDGSMIISSGAGGVKFWKIDRECLELPDRVFTTDDKCPSRTYYPPIPWVYQYPDNHSLRVSGDWSELSYHHNASGQPAWEKVTIRASNISPTLGLDYLAMGDSYSSGEGDLINGYIAGTEGENGCHLSASSYPYLLRQHWGVLEGKMASVACSGAKIRPDYTAVMDGYLGQNLQLLNYPEKDYPEVRKSALEDFRPGFVPQLEFVKKYKPAVITLTGGGNDVGFADIIKYCASPHVFQSNTCSYAKDGKALDTLKNSIYNQYSRITNLISGIKSASPLTKVYVVGYPQFVAQPGLLGCGLNAAALNSSEIGMVRNMVTEMNEVLWLAARDAGVQFVDVEDSLEGGQICGGGKYMTGFLNTGTSRERRSGMFHPNSLGHGRMAATIRQKVANFGEDATPTATRQAKSASDYISSSISIQKDIVLGGVYKDNTMAVRVPAATFEPETIVIVSMFSDPVELGRVVSGEDGSLTAEFDVPEEVGPGMHLLLLEGQTSAGEPIAIYEHITVGVREGDMDGDGIPDSEDRCQFITEWFDEETGVDVCKDPQAENPGGGDGSNQPGDTDPGDAEGDNPPSVVVGFLQKVRSIIKAVVTKVKIFINSFFTITRAAAR